MLRNCSRWDSWSRNSKVMIQPVPTDSTTGDTASQGSWTKPCWDALQAAETVAFILESSMHDLSIFSDHGRKGLARPEHAKKCGLPVDLSTSLTSPATDFGQHPSLALLLQWLSSVGGLIHHLSRWTKHFSPQYCTTRPERSGLSYTVVILELVLQHPTATCIYYIIFHKF